MEVVHEGRRKLWVYDRYGNLVRTEGGDKQGRDGVMRRFQRKVLDNLIDSLQFPLVHFSL